jgi:hypothetical protein
VQTAEAFAEAMNATGIPFATMSGLYGYPGDIGRDIDLLIQRKDIPRALALAEEVRQRFGWDSLLQRWFAHNSLTMFFVRKDEEQLTWLEVDLMHEGAVMMGAAPLVADVAQMVSRIDYYRGPFPVSKIGYYIKAQLRPLVYRDFDRFRVKYELEAVTDPDIIAYLRNLLGKRAAARFIAATHLGLAAVVPLSKTLKWAINLTYASRHPFNLLWNILWGQVIRPWKLYRYSSGLVFAIVTPDGSTETEVIDDAVRYFNGCFHVKRKQFIASSLDVIESRTRRVSNSSISAYWNFCFWFISLNFAYYFKDRFLPKSVIQFVLYDRSPGEVSVTPWRYRLSEVLAKLLRRLTPRPNEIVILPENLSSVPQCAGVYDTAAGKWSLAASANDLPVIRRSPDGSVSGRDLAKSIVRKLENIYIAPRTIPGKQPLEVE